MLKQILSNGLCQVLNDIRLNYEPQEVASLGSNLVLDDSLYTDRAVRVAKAIQKYDFGDLLMPLRDVLSHVIDEPLPPLDHFAERSENDMFLDYPVGLLLRLSDESWYLVTNTTSSQVTLMNVKGDENKYKATELVVLNIVTTDGQVSRFVDKLSVDTMQKVFKYFPEKVETPQAQLT